MPDPTGVRPERESSSSPSTGFPSNATWRDKWIIDLERRAEAADARADSYKSQVQRVLERIAEERDDGRELPLDEVEVRLTAAIDIADRKAMPLAGGRNADA